MKPKINIGYVSLFTVFLISIVLIISVTYGWEKYQSIKYPEKAARGEIKGIRYYYEQIGIKIKEIIDKNDIKSKRAMELAEAEKIINDKSNLYSLSVPQSWVLVTFSGIQGNTLSTIILQSSYFAAREMAGKKYIDAGAKFTGTVTQGENRSLIEGSGGHSNLIKSWKDKGEGGEYTCHIFKDSDSENAQVIEGHFLRNGKTYTFSLVFNPRNFSDAEYTFNEIMHSVQFK